jgi:hypothetical protein
MQRDILYQTQNRLRDIANGVKHTPLHTLQECCEEAGITPSWFGRYAAQYPDAPQVVLHHAKTPWKAGKKYYRKHEFVQWVNQVRQQKEKAMPDIKTALEKALSKTANAWAADDEAHQNIQTQQEKTVPTTTAIEKKDKSDVPNVSRITFEFIRDNPGLTHKQMTARLVAQGYKENTVASLAYQMLRVRLIVADANGGLSAVVPEYVPIQTSLQRKKKAKAAPAKSKQVTIINTRTGEVINPKPAGIAALPTTARYNTPAEWTVDSVIGSLNVRQAMAVYSELRNIFGA